MSALVGDSNDVTPAVRGDSHPNPPGGPGTGVFGTGKGPATGVYGGSASGNGVYGESSKGVGVTGASMKSYGIQGESTEAPGGKFLSLSSGQIELTPRQVEFIPGEQEPLPKLSGFAEPGELAMVADGDGNCTLWMCIHGFEPGHRGAAGTTTLIQPATWAKVQLGATVGGSGVFTP